MIAVVHLATNPTGIILALLVVALVLFVVAAVIALLEHSIRAVLISLGLAAFVIAFLA